MSQTRRKPEPIVAGRRVCTGPCGRWRPIHDFGHKADRRAPEGRYVSGICEACQRAYGRSWYSKNADHHKRRVRQWRQENPELVEQYRQRDLERRKSDPDARARDRERFRERYHRDNRLREYYREYRNMKRHELGEGRSEKAVGGRSSSGYREASSKKETTVPVGPFLDWLETSDMTMLRLAQAMGIDERRVRAVRDSERVTVAFVDRALHAAGGMLSIWDLYDEDQMIS